MAVTAYLLGDTRPIPLSRGDALTIGRDRQNSVFLDDTLASRRHAAISCEENGEIAIKDLGSTNKTFVNGEPIRPLERISLKHGDQIRIGGKLFHLVMNTEGSDSRQAALKRSTAVSTMDTVSTGLFFKDGKVVQVPGAQEPAAAGPRVGNTQRLTPVAEEVPAALSGQLEMQSLPQVLQFLHHNNHTGQLRVQAPGQSGSLLFDKGRVFSAQAEGLQGEEAIYGLALVRKGTFSFIKSTQRPAGAENIRESMMQIVFECCRRIDDDERTRSEPIPSV